MRIDTYALVPYAPVMPITAHNAGVFEIIPTDSHPFTIGNPQSAPGDPLQADPKPSHVHHSSGRTIVIKIKNTGMMMLGPATWDSHYKLAPWVQPAPGFERSITFRTLDGTLWYEESRTGGHTELMVLFDPTAQQLLPFIIGGTLSDTQPV